MPKQKRIKHFKVSGFKNPSGGSVWKVSGTRKNGERVRENKKTKAEALERMGELELEYEDVDSDLTLRRTVLSEDQLSDATAAFALSGGRPLRDIARDYIDVLKRVDKQHVTLDAALDYFERNYQPDFVEVSLGAAIESFLATKSSSNHKTREHYMVGLGHLKGLDPNTSVHLVETGDIQGVLDQYNNPHTQRTYRQAISSFFQWCIENAHAQVNPCKKIKLRPIKRVISILSFEEVKRLLVASTRYHDGVFVPIVALGLFGGLRPSEIRDLSPENIKRRHITVDGGKLSATMHRHVPMNEALKYWLEKYPFEGLPGNHVYLQKILKAATGAKEWTQDIIRHTSISYQAMRDKDKEMVAFNNGTSVEMLDKHYLRLIDHPEQVPRFWSLTPESLLAEKISVKLPSTAKQVVWPTDAQLAKLVFEKPLTILGKELGVSDNAVRKRCIARAIALPKNGYWQRKHASGG